MVSSGKIAILGMVALVASSCGGQIDDISDSPGLNPAIGQCIEVIGPVKIRPRDAQSNRDFLIILSGNLGREADEGYFPPGTRFTISRFTVERSFENNYFFVYGIVQNRPGSIREVNLQPLIDFSWILHSAENIQNNRAPGLPPTGKIPLRPDTAKYCP